MKGARKKRFSFLILPPCLCVKWWVHTVKVRLRERKELKYFYVFWWSVRISYVQEDFIKNRKVILYQYFLEQTCSCIYIYFDFSLFLTPFLIKTLWYCFHFDIYVRSVPRHIEIPKAKQKCDQFILFYPHFQRCQNEENVYYLSTTTDDLTEIWWGKKMDLLKSANFHWRKTGCFQSWKTVQSYHLSLLCCVLFHKVILLKSGFTTTFKRFSQHLDVLMAEGCPLPLTPF